MSIILWIIFGALAGWIASLIVGIVGAFIGGYVFSFFGGTGVSGFNLPSLLVAIVGAVILLFIVKAIRGRT